MLVQAPHKGAVPGGEHIENQYSQAGAGHGSEVHCP